MEVCRENAWQTMCSAWNHVWVGKSQIIHMFLAHPRVIILISCMLWWQFMLCGYVVIISCCIYVKMCIKGDHKELWWCTHGVNGGKCPENALKRPFHNSIDRLSIGLGEPKALAYRACLWKSKLRLLIDKAMASLQLIEVALDLLQNLAKNTPWKRIW